MCIDANTSLNTFLIGSISGLILIIQNMKFIGMKLIFVSLVQLAEYFMWTDLKCVNGRNQFGNFIGIISLLLQLVGANFISKGSTPVNILSLFIYLYVLIKYIYNKTPCSIEGYKGHLKWGFVSSLTKKEAQLLTMHYLINVYFQPNETPYTIILYSLLLLYTINITGNNIYDVNYWGSYWCYLSNMIGPILVFANFIKLYVMS